MRGDYTSQILLLQVILTCVWLGCAMAACGGCSGHPSEEPVCWKTVYKQERSWWFTYKTVSSREKSCCGGYSIVENKCRINSICGGCQDTGPTNQRLCMDTVSKKVLYSQLKTYKCGVWSPRTCYYSITQYRTSYHLQGMCCSGFNQQGSLCVKPAPVPTPAPTPVPSPNLSCGTTNAANRFIVGGSAASPGEIPWQVLLAIRLSGDCGGAIVGSRWILTAAHCVVNKLRHDVTAILGDAARTNIAISNIYIHPGYNSHTMSADIALIKTDAVISFNNYVNSVCLSSSGGHVSYVGKTVTISGWGQTQPGARVVSSAPGVLQKAEVKIVSVYVCKNYYFNDVSILCALDGEGGHSKSSCYGDSGSPMTIKTGSTSTLIGLASMVSSGGCATGKPFVYTEVAPYLSWISQKMS